MAVRRDKVQLNIEFITDESRALAKANTDTKALTRELRKTVKEGGDVADVMRRISEAGGKVEDLDLSKVAPAQLVTRARQLKQVLDQIPSSTPQAAKLSAEYKKINDRLATIRRNARGVAAGTKSAGGGFTALAGKVTGFLAVITAAFAAVQGLFRFISGGVQQAAAFEQLNASLETFLGSAEKAQELVKELNEFSIATPFETDQINQAGRALLAFGTAQEEVVPTLREIGTVAAATGKDINELTLIYGKARAAGRIQGEELNQLAEAGIPIYEELGKVLGVNASEIRKLGEQGRLSFEDLQAVFTNLTQEGGKFDGLLEKQSTTLSGLASTARGAFAALQRNIGEAFTPLLKTILPPVIRLINRIVAGVAPVAKAFGETLVRAFNFLRQAVQPVFNAFGRLRDAVGELGTNSEQISLTFQALGAVFALISNVIASVITNVSRLLSVFSSLGGGEGGIINEVLTSPLKFALRVITQFAAVLNGLVSASRVATDELRNVFGIFTDSIGLAFQKVKGFFGADNEREIFEGEQRLAARFNASGRKIGDAFREGYQDALGDIEVKNLIKEKDETGNTLATITNPLGDKPPTEAELRKEAEERARIEAEIARRAKNKAIAKVLGADRITDIARGLAGLGPEVDQVDTTSAEIEQAQDRATKLLEIEKALSENKIELLKRERDFRAELQQEIVGAAVTSADLAIQLLGRDEEARKKNAKAIKAFQIGQALATGFSELQQVRLATEAQAATAALTPLGAFLVPGIRAKGAVRAGRSIVQTAINVGNIAATKFARGGTPKVGQFGGRSHSAGGTRGYFDDGTQIEVEAGETFAVVNKNAQGFLSFLSDTNAATGGVPFFQQGGIVAGPSTTPVIGPETAAAVPGGGAAAMNNAAARFERAAASIQNIRASVAFTDIETTGQELNAARAAAEV